MQSRCRNETTENAQSVRFGDQGRVRRNWESGKPNIYITRSGLERGIPLPMPDLNPSQVLYIKSILAPYINESGKTRLIWIRLSWVPFGSVKFAIPRQKFLKQPANVWGLFFHHCSQCSNGIFPSMKLRLMKIEKSTESFFYNFDNNNVLFKSANQVLCQWLYALAQQPKVLGLSLGWCIYKNLGLGNYSAGGLPNFSLSLKKKKKLKSLAGAFFSLPYTCKICIK